MPKRILYRIPYAESWRSDLVSESFVRTQLAVARASFADTEKDLTALDLDVAQVEQEIRAKWADANVQVMRGFEQRLRQIRRERGHICYVQRRLDLVFKRIESIASRRGWKL